jgi:ABC-type proline/glycine betaine transport system permease subunit
MWIKLLFIVVLLAIVVSLGVALLALTRDNGASQRMVRALTWRTLLSIALFLLLLLAFAVGLVKPHAPGFLHSSSASTAYHQ